MLRIQVFVKGLLIVKARKKSSERQTFEMDVCEERKSDKSENKE